jgi:hypothetical protein
MRYTVIKFPSTDEDYHHLEAEFSQRYRFPGVVGVLDGTHIPIPGPPDHGDSYINSKGFASMHLQVSLVI